MVIFLTEGSVDVSQFMQNREKEHVYREDGYNITIEDGK